MRLYKRGNTYWIDYRDGDGKRARESLRTTKRREAEAKARGLYTSIPSKPRQPRKPPKPSPRVPRKPPKPRGPKFREILGLWLKYQNARCKPRSILLYKVVRKRFGLVWGNLRPEQITSLVVEEFQESALTGGLSPRTINTQLGVALSALKWAADRGLTNTHPPKVKRLKVNGTRARKYLSPTELERLLNKVREPRWQRLEVVVYLSLYAGMRVDESIWLTWDDVDLDGDWLYVRAKDRWSPKSAYSERAIPLADDLAKLLAAQIPTGRWVAPQSPGKQWDSRHLAGETRRLFRAAGVDDGGPHTLHRLRGTFATTVLRGGGDLESLRDLLGHSSLAVTAGYLTATSESKVRAVRGVKFGESPG